MRVKISFLRVHSSINTVPLHHQKLVSAFVEQIIAETGVRPKHYNFSSLKGTSKVQNGFMKFMSSKISLVVSSESREFINAFIRKIFEKPTVFVGKLNLIPKTYQLIDQPAFQTQMRYVCISPMVVADPEKDPTLAQTIIDPASHEFSDYVYNSVADAMEKDGYKEDEMSQFAEFEIVPDVAYLNKLNAEGKKFARHYKNNQDLPMIGYLIPFTLHAHPKVHEFIWNGGLGMVTTHGYGMVDLVREEGSSSSAASAEETHSKANEQTAAM